MDSLGFDIEVGRKMDTVQIIRKEHSVLCTMTAETSIKLAHELLRQADIILKSTTALEDDDE